MQFLTTLFDQANEFLVAQLGELGPLIAAGGLGLLLVLLALPAMLFKKKDPLDRIKEMAAWHRQHRRRCRNPAPGRQGTGGSTGFPSTSSRRTQAEFSAARLNAGARRLPVQERGADVSLCGNSRLASAGCCWGRWRDPVGRRRIGAELDPDRADPRLCRLLCAEILGGSGGCRTAPTRVTRGGGFPDALDLMLVCVEDRPVAGSGHHPRRQGDPHRLSGAVRGVLRSSPTR